MLAIGKDEFSQKEIPRTCLKTKTYEIQNPSVTTKFGGNLSALHGDNFETSLHVTNACTDRIRCFDFRELLVQKNENKLEQKSKYKNERKQNKTRTSFSDGIDGSLIIIKMF